MVPVKAGTSLKFLGIAVAALTVAGCASMKTPDRLYSADTEMGAIRADVDAETAELKTLTKSAARRKRNEIIAARKYAIDLQYSQYEAALTHESQAVDFASQAATIALHTTADYIPVEHTARMLNGIGTGVTATNLAYSDKILRVKLIENLQASMRIARHDKAAAIYANMHCSIKSYPMAMALSDLEAYYRAGTVPAGLIKLNQTIAKAEVEASAIEDSQKPSSPTAQAQLSADAAQAEFKRRAAMTTGKHNCKFIAEED
jgi:hypothetical protein